MVVILTMIIHRPEELKKLEEGKKWILVYGRRKTGKTFLVENNMKYDLYFFVNRDRTIISKTEAKQVSYDAFLEVLKLSLESGKTIVIDEFHRLGDSFFDFLHSSKKTGRLILLTSTLYLAKKLLSSNSPLLGLFKEIRIYLISLSESLKALENIDIGKRERLELAIILREPIAIEYFDEKKNARETLAEILISSINTRPALTGEIFAEEDRNMSAAYKAIIGAVASGKMVSGEISSHLFSKRLIKKDDPSIIQQYLENLLKIGILRKLEIFGKKRFVYKIESPLVRLFYYADEKYGISDRKLSEEEATRIIDEIMPKIVEDNVREFLSESLGLKETVVEAADYEIDGYLLKFKQPSVLLEVKWKQKVSSKEVEHTEKNLNILKAERKILFVQDSRSVHSETLEVMDVSDLASLKVK